MKLIASLITCCLLLCFSGPESQGEDFGTLIHSVGDISYRNKQSGEWMTPASGTKLYHGDTLKTALRSSALILNPDGSLILLEESSSHRYKLYGESGHGLSQLDSLLARFFAIGQARRYATDRSNLSSQKEWLRLMGKNRFSPEDLELSFEMINHYNKTGQWNRVSALLMKLKTVFPENPGFYQLSRQVLSGHQPMANWRMTRIVNGRIFETEDENQVVQDEQIAIHHFKNEESYCFLFVTHLYPDGRAVTRMLFPRSIAATKTVHEIDYFESRLGSAEPFHFIVNPEPEMSGRMHFWGWSCDGPVIAGKEIEIATRQIEKHLLLGNKLTAGYVSLVTPDICRSSFARNLVFVEKPPVALNR